MAKKKQKKIYRVYGYKDVEEPDDKTAFQAFNYMDLHKVTTIGCQELEGLDELKAEEEKRIKQGVRRVNQELIDHRQMFFELIKGSYEWLDEGKKWDAWDVLDYIASMAVTDGMFNDDVVGQYIDIVESGIASSSEFFVDGIRKYR